VKNRFQNLPFKFNLQRYNAARRLDPVGLYKLRTQLTHSFESAWFQPLEK
jgi:hypothetical protein